MAINFFTEETKEIRIPRRKIRTWVNQCIASYGKILGDINYIFCSDEYLKRINIEYLKHDYYTDIITFNNNDNDIINGDLYISIDRVKENSKEYDVSFHNELQRVVIHGILHLVGFNDSTDNEKEQMRKEEDKSLVLYNKLWKEF